MWKIFFEWWPIDSVWFLDVEGVSGCGCASVGCGLGVLSMLL